MTDITLLEFVLGGLAMYCFGVWIGYQLWGKKTAKKVVRE